MANEFVARRGIIAQSGGAKITGSLLVSGTVDASGYNIIAQSFTGSFSGSIGTATTASYVRWVSVDEKPQNLVSSSTQFNSLSAPFTGSFTGSFTGDGSNLTNIATTLGLTGSTGGVNTNGSVNLRTQTLIVSASNGITATISGQTLNISTSGSITSSAQVVASLPAGTISSSTQFKTLTDTFTGSFTGSFNGTLPYSGLTGVPSLISSSTQIDWTQVNYNAGIVSSSAQTVANIAGQTIAPSVVNATGVISGASIQTSGNGIIGGNLNVSGLLTATSTSFQYVTSSQLNVADNKITVNTNDLLRFGGLSVVDSGSASPVTASIYWDSINHKFLYENLSGSTYNSSIFIAGPINTGTTGNEPVMTIGRVPVATGEDHIDSRAASSSIRVDFATRRTDIEAALFVTGALTANGTVTLQGIPSASAQIKALLPIGTVTSSAQYPGWVTASSQVVWSQVNPSLLLLFFLPVFLQRS